MVEHRLTAAEAATQIIGLINSRPATPWPQEIEAIIARLAAPISDSASTLGDVSPALAAAFAEWDAVRAQYDAAGELYGRTDDATDEADAERWANVFGEKTKALLDLGVRSFADLQLLLPVVIYWNSPICVKSPPYPYCTLQEGGEDEGESLEPKSTAYFVRAVIDLLSTGSVAPANIPATAISAEDVDGRVTGFITPAGGANG